jgi:hypothetical protein
MGDEMGRGDELPRELDEQQAVAVTDGILDGGHYDSEPCSEDLDRRSLTVSA